MATKAAAKPPASNKPSASIEKNGKSTDLPVEELHYEPEPTPESSNLPAVMTVEQRAKNEVARFDLARAVITAKKAEFKDLKIAGPDDKEGEKKVTAAWQWFRNKRLAVSKKHQEIKADYLFITREIDKEKNDLTGLLEEGENQHGDELDRVEKIRTDAKEAEERARQQKLQGRVAELINAGMAFTGSYYTIGDTISMDVVILKDMADDKFGELLARVQAENKRIIDAQAEKDRIEKEERDRLEKQRQDQLLKEEQQRQRAEDLERKEQALIASRTKARGKMLESLGMEYSFGNFVFQFGTLNHGREYLHKNKVDDLEDEAFDIEYERLSGAILSMKAKQAITDSEKRVEEKRLEDQRAKDREDKIALDNRIAVRVMEARGIGLDEHPGGYRRVAKYPILNGVGFGNVDIKLLNPEKWDELISATKISLAKLIADEAAEDQRLEDEAEKERHDGLSDGDALMEWNTRFIALIEKLPKGKSKKMVSTFNGIRGRLNQLEGDIKMVIPAKK